MLIVGNIILDETLQQSQPAVVKEIDSSGEISFLKYLWNMFVYFLFILKCFLVMPHNIWHLSSLTRD